MGYILAQHECLQRYAKRKKEKWRKLKKKRMKKAAILDFQVANVLFRKYGHRGPYMPNLELVSSFE